jgi:hypothetical protein
MEVIHTSWLSDTSRERMEANLLNSDVEIIVTSNEDNQIRASSRDPSGSIHEEIATGEKKQDWDR